MPTFMDGLWRILFTIPLPLALNATAAQQHELATASAAPVGNAAAARAGCVRAHTIDSTPRKVADSAMPSAKGTERGDNSGVHVAHAIAQLSLPPPAFLLNRLPTFFGVVEVAVFFARAPPVQNGRIAYSRSPHPSTRSLPNALWHSPPRCPGKDHTPTTRISPVDFAARFGHCIEQTPAFDRARSTRFLLRVPIRAQRLVPLHPS